MNSMANNIGIQELSDILCTDSRTSNHSNDFFRGIDPTFGRYKSLNANRVNIVFDFDLIIAKHESISSVFRSKSQITNSKTMI